MTNNEAELKKLVSRAHLATPTKENLSQEEEN